MISRNTLGSNALYTNFTSLSGKKSNLSYYGFVNYKKGNGFRENSEFESFNSFLNLNYNFNEKSKLSAEVTFLEYLAHQAGGVSDQMFKTNPLQTNRKRNWFEVNWLLFNLKYTRKINENSNFDLTFFGLEAKRNALGFRSNRVDQIDPGTERDLIKGEFSNLGIEARFLTNYKINQRKSILLIGIFQILALIPGVSRAGITITAARFLKFNRVDAGKISFLLSIPALAGASFLGLMDLQNESLEINILTIVAVILSSLFSYVTVKYFLEYLNKFSLNIFVIYRLIIALILLSIIYF